MLPKTRKNFPNKMNHNLTSQEYSVAIEVALKREIGTSRHAVKTLARMTNASERTVQNWLGGIRGPSGVHLILLAQNFASVRSTIMFLAGQGMQQAYDSDVVVQLLSDAIALLSTSRGI